jgi:hypothetical protein
MNPLKQLPMKTRSQLESSNTTRSNKTLQVVLVALLSFSGVICERVAAQDIDPNLSLTINRTNQNVVLRWFGSNTVPYQVEASTTLAGWTNSSLVVTGSGAFISITNPIVANTNAFFRVK